MSKKSWRIRWNSMEKVERGSLAEYGMSMWGEEFGICGFGDFLGFTALSTRRREEVCVVGCGPSSPLAPLSASHGNLSLTGSFLLRTKEVPNCCCTCHMEAGTLSCHHFSFQPEHGREECSRKEKRALIRNQRLFERRGGRSGWDWENNYYCLSVPRRG